MLMISVACIVLIFNTFYFLFNRRRQEKYYEKYCNRKSLLGSIVVGIYIVFVFSLTIWIATKCREKNLEMKQQTSEMIEMNYVVDKPLTYRARFHLLCR
jgi:uncharacterized membrane protein